MKTSHGLAIDGFMRGNSGHSGSTLKSNYKITEASNLLKAHSAPTRLKAAAQGVHKRAQRSQTLMRGAVKKPATKAKVSSPVVVAPPKARTAAPGSSRLTRAQSATQSPSVRRFGHVSAPRFSKSSIKKQSTQVQVTPPQASQAAKNLSSVAVYKPLPSMLTSVSHQKLERMLDEALLKADSHKNGQSRSGKNLWQKIKFAPRWLTISAGLLAVVLAGGYIAMQKIPQVSMGIAAARAHVSAHVPAYTPSGFSLATPVKSSGGSVTAKFKSNDHSGRTFTLTQQASSMDSKSLSDSVVPKNSQVQTSQVEGTTVYIYGAGNNAAWVNNGTQYTINDSANLNSNQILNIAGSL